MTIKSIQMKIALMTGAFLLLATGVILVYGFISSKSVTALVDKQSNEGLLSQAAQQANVIQSTLQVNLDTARTTAMEGPAPTRSVPAKSTAIDTVKADEAKQDGDFEEF